MGHKAFTDVVAGSSVGCNTDGFHAGPGWDVASGWGTPDFLAIKNMTIGQ
jgi:tripeptidyl-peptidase-1